MKKKKRMIIIPQIIHDNTHNLFSTFYYLKHYHNGKTYFIEANVIGGESVIISPYSSDNKHAKIDVASSDGDPDFSSILNYTSKRFKRKNVFISISNASCVKMMRMLRDVKSNFLSYRDAFGSLEHTLDFRFYLPNQGQEQSLKFASTLEKLIPDKFTFRVYVDSSDDTDFESLVKDRLKSNRLDIELINGFSTNFTSTQEMIYYFNHHFDNVHEAVLYRPIFEKLDC